MKKIKLLIPTFFLFSTLVFAQQTEFTVEDILRVKSLNSQTLSPDGIWLAGIISDGKARFGTDHFRFRDPSYLNVRPGIPVLINTESGEQVEIFGAQARIMDLTWSEDGGTLFFFEQKDEELVLGSYNVKKNKVDYPKINNSDRITDVFGITPSPNGESIIVGMREEDWFDKAMEEYKEATEGPIVVYDGSADFLKWDQIGVTASQASLVSIDLKSGRISELLPVSSYSGIQFSENGQFLRFNETIRNKTSYSRNDESEYQVGYLDLETPDSVKYIYERNEKRRNYDWDDQGLRYAWLDSGNVLINSLESPLEEPLNLTKGKAFEDEEKEKEVKFSITSFSPSGNQLLLSSENAWWTIDSNGDNLTQIYELPKKEERDKAPSRNYIKWSEDENFIYVSYSEKDQWNRGIQRFNILEGDFEDLMTSSDLYSNWSFADESDRVVYSLSDGDRPDDVYSSTLAFDNQNRLTDLNPWVSEKKWTKSELITYRDVDGEELKGILYYPVDYDPEKKYPLVLEVYETFFNNGYRSSMNLIANQGYFGLRPSVDLEEGYPGEAWMKGVAGAINKLVEEGKVDNDKVGIHGTSYGGYATSLLITQTDRFAAAINISGKVNIISFLGDSPKIGTRNYAAAEVGQDRIGGQFWDEPLKYFQTTAVLYADRIKTPHLLLTGEGDWNVPGTNTRELYYAMRRLGKDVTWVNYMRGGHGAGWASVESDYYDQWERMLTFYEKYFFPEEKDESKED
ncbi:alpha/beta hydrolase family protein [Algoriphagus sediminis]|uniref:Prolyl oligopeptidase family serine peptidase n=1 Tax=Algoriphagus sediminis TaxID=3057113 RepID=A0ABT7YB63_9BACT|nr:prolyl oligopeptidase family serine peptidase [Algoriphagus sediminis]MDN3203765.1 prolyl oligopeptidase family serine peptidase [Algoriphagus sediminis]